MILYSFFLFIIVAVFATFTNWRGGLFMMVIIAALQDPLRKLAPGTPSYFVIASSPIWFIVLVAAFSKIPHLWANFRASHRLLSASMKIFMISLIPGALLSVSYGPGSWKFTILGLLSYGGILTGWLIGFAFLRDKRDITNLLAFYCLVTAVMLTGTHIQFLKLAPGWSILGTDALGMHWIRYTDYGPVDLFAGFYRSPDIMGWHAVMAAMCSLILGFRERGARRLFWFLVAIWAIGAAMLCGRRKMIMMLPLFGIIFSWIYWRAKSATRAVAIAGTLVAIFVVGYTVYNQFSADEGIEQYYFRNLGNVPIRVKLQGIDSVIETYRQSGFFGEGPGFAVQGAQNVEGDKPRTWQEGGFEKILVELGVPGFLGFLLLAYALIRAILKVIFQQLSPQSTDFPLFAGIAAMIIANMGSFIVSHQIFGDFFILIFYSFLIGILLSIGRVEAQGRPSPAAGGLLDSKKWQRPKGLSSGRFSLPAR